MRVKFRGERVKPRVWWHLCYEAYVGLLCRSICFSEPRPARAHGHRSSLEILKPSERASIVLDCVGSLRVIVLQCLLKNLMSHRTESVRYELHMH